MAPLTQTEILNELGGILKYSNIKPSKETLHGNALLRHFNHSDICLITEEVQNIFYYPVGYKVIGGSCPEGFFPHANDTIKIFSHLPCDQTNSALLKFIAIGSVLAMIPGQFGVTIEMKLFGGVLAFASTSRWCDEHSTYYYEEAQTCLLDQRTCGLMEEFV